MKIHEPKRIKVEIEEKDMKILINAYDILDTLASKLEDYKGIEVEYSVYEETQNSFFEFLNEMKGYISDITDDW